jgi:hypothetical protein
MDNILIVSKDDEIISALKGCLAAEYIHETAIIITATAVHASRCEAQTKGASKCPKTGKSD